MKKEKLPTMTWHGRNKIIKMSKTLKLQSEIAQPLGESIFSVSRELCYDISVIYCYIVIIAEPIARIMRYLLKRRFKMITYILETIKEYLHKKYSPECIINTVLKGKLCIQNTQLHAQ